MNKSPNQALLEKLKEYKKLTNNQPLTSSLNVDFGKLSLQDVVSKKNVDTQNQIVPNFIRKNRKQSVAKTTKVTGQLSIISHLNNLPQNKGNKCIIIDESSSQSQKQKISEIINMKPFYYYKQSSSVKEYAYREDQNIAYKEGMEDKGKSIDNFYSKPNQSLFCLFDGHGGDMVSKYLQKNFHLVYKDILTAYHFNIEQSLIASFKEIDKKIKDLELVSVGSTGCVVHVVQETVSTLRVYCANVGDTRCCLISPVNHRRLTYDHRADDPEEKKRILNSGGSVINGRVMGALMLSRAFGDFEFKSFGVKCDPYFHQIQIDLNEKNQFLIIACDGVWDVMDEDDIRQLIMFCNNSEELCKQIIKGSIKRGAWDNLSVFVVKLT